MKRSSFVPLSLLMLVILLGSGFIISTSSSKTAYARALSTPVATEVALNAGYEPWGVAFDKSGNVWVAVPQCDPSPTCASTTPPGKIDVYNPTTKSWVTSYQLPAGFGQALFLAFDKSGNVWFPMPMTNSLGMLNPVNGTYSQWQVPTAGAGPWDIAIDSQGIVWFTEHYSNKIGAFDPSTQTFREIATPATNSVPYGITIDGSDNVWFTENSDAVALIGEYTASGTLNEYKIRDGSTTGLTPHLIAIDPTGNVWWSEGWVGAIGKLLVSQASPGTTNGVTEYAYQPLCASCGTHTSGITVDGNGLVWFDDSIQALYGYMPTTGTAISSVFAVPAGSNSHPHDGLRAASDNVVWFTEEFANNLGTITLSDVTPTPTTTATITPTVTVTPTATPIPGSTLGQDTFQRANQTLWGNASDGQTWGGDANISSNFSISSNTGLVNNAGSSSAVLGPTATNAEVLFSGSISDFTNNNFGAVTRWTDGNNWYKAYIDGSNLVIQKKVNGVATVLTTVPFVATAGTSYTLRFNVSGTSLNAKVWATSGTEPTSWMATVTDSSLSAGQAGLRILSQNATTTITAYSATNV
jgi:streptogramin lyase